MESLSEREHVVFLELLLLTCSGHSHPSTGGEACYETRAAVLSELIMYG